MKGARGSFLSRAIDYWGDDDEVRGCRTVEVDAPSEFDFDIDRMQSNLAMEY